MVEVTVSRLGHDGAEKMFVVILAEQGGERILPIWIGRPEADAIAAQIYSVPRERPMTHDLLRSVVAATQATLERVCISRVVEHTFYAELHLRCAGEPVVVDARPSDAIALALRCEAPIFANPELLEVYEPGDAGEGAASAAPDATDAAPTGGGDPLAGDSGPSDAERLRKYLERLRPEDFGKFRM
ncbi:MAG: bifunctional nuclease family protein [Gemmatimonadetes bacterium]|nr:bifunctional nuclease family protein [Gemmatimonadota bacterium]